jgi:hypothetical protein
MSLSLNGAFWARSSSSRAPVPQLLARLGAECYVRSPVEYMNICAPRGGLRAGLYRHAAEGLSRGARGRYGCLDNVALLCVWW